MRTLKLIALGLVAVTLMVGSVGVVKAQSPSIEALLGRQYPGFVFIVLTADSALGPPTVTVGTTNLGINPFTFVGGTQTTWLFFGSADVLHDGDSLNASFSSASKSAQCRNSGAGVLCL